jgi:stearoyl-CoA desaturase (delta-9 desaturase)|tara:strand:+ start:419 stop:1057 length:639 start_codon:yes stop_codon:yes gene_type:complete
MFIFTSFFAIVIVETFIHRYCSHRAFELNKKIETFLLYCTTLTMQPPPLAWAPNHITHHRYSDKEGDSHPASNGWKTWFWYNTYKNNMMSGHTVKRLLKNRHFRIQYENYFKIYYMFMILCLLISPFYTLCMILIPATFSFHISSVTNVLCHTIGWGYRNFDTNDNSVNINIFPVNCATLHNNHHANPTAINNGVKWYEIDMAYYVIKLIRK